MDISLSRHSLLFSGTAGSLVVRPDDDITRRLAMLIEGECEVGASAAAKKFGLSRPRYYQLLHQFEQFGAAGLTLRKTGPKSDYRRTDQLVRLVIRHRFLDSEASPAVITQKLRQLGHIISQRSVERIIAGYGLQKKTLRT